jgi:hypothetical protein
VAKCNSPTTKSSRAPDVNSFGLSLVYTSTYGSEMKNIVEDFDDGKLANGESCRDLRTGPKPGMQLTEAIDNTRNFLRREGASFFASSTSHIPFNITK